MIVLNFDISVAIYQGTASRMESYCVIIYSHFPSKEQAFLDMSFYCMNRTRSWTSKKKCDLQIGKSLDLLCIYTVKPV